MAEWISWAKDQLRPHRQLLLRLLIAAVFLGIVSATVHTIPFFKGAQADTIYSAASPGYSRATIIEKSSGTITVKMLDGNSAGQLATVQEGAYLQQTNYQRGEMVLVLDSGGSDAVRITDKWRLPFMAMIVAVFFAMIALIGGKRGVMSSVGLVISIGVLLGMVVPAILQGYDTFLVILLGAAVICVVSVYVAHGISYRTTISVASILCILLAIMMLSWLSVSALGLTGRVDEMSANLGISHPSISLSGLLAGGIVIATLGMLDDVVTTQVAAIDNILGARPKIKRRELFRRGMDIGREHIASLVNTLALAYAGVSFPLIVMYAAGGGYVSPVLFLNSEFITQEVTRTVVASLGLLVAVPVSTYAATIVLTRVRSKKLSTTK